MTRSIAKWIGITAVCLAILFIPVMSGATKAVEDASRGWVVLEELESATASQVHAPAKDKDCIGRFESEKQAQRFFLRHGGPKRDPHGLDRDGDGKACEEFDYD